MDDVRNRIRQALELLGLRGDVLEDQVERVDKELDEAAREAARRDIEELKEKNEFDALLEKMQTPTVREAMKSAFDHYRNQLAAARDSGDLMIEGIVTGYEEKLAEVQKKCDALEGTLAALRLHLEVFGILDKGTFDRILEETKK